MKTTIYAGKAINILSILLDLDVAFIENESGEILHVKYSLIN